MTSVKKTSPTAGETIGRTTDVSRSRHWPGPTTVPHGVFGDPGVPKSCVPGSGWSASQKRDSSSLTTESGVCLPSSWRAWPGVGVTVYVSSSMSVSWHLIPMMPEPLFSEPSASSYEYPMYEGSAPERTSPIAK